MFTRGLSSGPLAVAVANHLFKTHNLVAIIASVDCPVIKVPENIKKGLFSEIKKVYTADFVKEWMCFLLILFLA